jgi:hypothetical protein
MGGNVVDSRAPFGGVAGTLLGPEGTATVEPGSCGPGSSRVVGSLRFRVQTGDVYRAAGLVVVWCVSCGLGFGGVFVNWIVDASI